MNACMSVCVVVRACVRDVYTFFLFGFGVCDHVLLALV